MSVFLPNRDIADLGQLIGATAADQEAMAAIDELFLQGNRIASLTVLAPLEDDNRTSGPTSGSRAVASGLRGARSVLTPLRHLRVLNLSRNSLRSLEGMAAVARTLAVLDVSENFLTNLHGLERCSHLTSINASSNQIDSLEGLPAQLPRPDSSDSPSGEEDLPGLKLELRGNLISNVQHLLACPHVLASLVLLDVSENPLPLVTQLPLVLERCSRPHIDLVVGGSYQERNLLREMLGKHVRVSSLNEQLDASSASNPPASRHNRSEGNNATAPVATTKGGVDPSRGAARQSGREAVIASAERASARDSQESGHNTTTDGSQQGAHAPSNRSAALQAYTGMPDRELLQHLVLTREENARYELETLTLKKKVKELQRMVSSDMTKVRDLKQLVEGQECEMGRLRESLKKKRVEVEGLKGQLEAARDEATSGRVRSRFFQRENELLESHVAQGQVSQELFDLRALCKRQQRHIEVVSEENDHLTAKLHRMTEKLLRAAHTHSSYETSGHDSHNGSRDSPRQGARPLSPVDETSENQSRGASRRVHIADSRVLNLGASPLSPPRLSSD